MPPVSELPGGPGRAPSAEPPWRTVTLGDALDVAIPGHWVDSPVVAEDDFAHWMARDWRDRDVTLWLRLESHHMEGNAAAPTGAAGPDLLAWLRRGYGEDADRRVITAASQPDRAVLRTVEDFTAADGAPFLHHRWHLAELQPGLLREATAMLTVPADRERQSRLAGLVDRFAAELPRIRLRPGLPAAPAAPAADGDPYREWQTITCYGCIRLRVPAVWSCGYDPHAGMWCGYRRDDGRDENSGVMWLTYDVYADNAVDRPAFEHAELDIPAPDDAVDVRRDGARGDRVLRYRQLGREDDETLVFTRWMRGIVRERRFMILHVSLVFSELRADAPEVARFVEQMDSEVRAAEITIPDY